MINRDDSMEELVYQIAIILQLIETHLHRIAERVDPGGVVSSDEGD